MAGHAPPRSMLSFQAWPGEPALYHPIWLQLTPWEGPPLRPRHPKPSCHPWGSLPSSYPWVSGMPKCPLLASTGESPGPPWGPQDPRPARAGRGQGVHPPAPLSRAISGNSLSHTTGPASSGHSLRPYLASRPGCTLLELNPPPRPRNPSVPPGRFPARPVFPGQVRRQLGLKLDNVALSDRGSQPATGWGPWPLAEEGASPGAVGWH